MPRETTAMPVPSMPTKNVPQSSAFGIMRSGFFVSSARYVTDSHPKKLSEHKNIARKREEMPKGSKGERFAMFNCAAPGMIIETMMENVTMANSTSTNADASMP